MPSAMSDSFFHFGTDSFFLPSSFLSASLSVVFSTWTIGKRMNSECFFTKSLMRRSSRYPFMSSFSFRTMRVPRPTSRGASPQITVNLPPAEDFQVYCSGSYLMKLKLNKCLYILYNIYNIYRRICICMCVHIYIYARPVGN